MRLVFSLVVGMKGYLYTVLASILTSGLLEDANIE
jgi:hypothetical protein